ncbi:PepSY domain-containing protein [Neobacillus mesonae]|uniref:PepSY domain-containing protein n=1 Tax=Neobacillus mesonae TaxID=1193713 RepID=UPI002572ACCE|nr:PepSY domain-containing protein [Neobacillus mesonae]
MRKKRWIWILISIFTVVILFIGFLQWNGLNSKAAALSKEKATDLVEQRYKGKVTKINKVDGQYTIEMNRNKMRYEIKLQSNGQVLSFSKIDSNEKQDQPQTKTDAEIKKLLFTEFKGEIVSFKKHSEKQRDIYDVVLQSKDRKSIVKVDAQTGEIIFRKIIEFNKPTVKVSEAEASKIALKQVKGKVDDIELEESGGTSYYLVDIDTEDDREATIQIHAITGEVLSVTWDD